MDELRLALIRPRGVLVVKDKKNPSNHLGFARFWTFLAVWKASFFTRFSLPGSRYTSDVITNQKHWGRRVNRFGTADAVNVLGYFRFEPVAWM